MHASNNNRSVRDLNSLKNSIRKVISNRPLQFLSVVETIIDDQIIEKQSEADLNLQKFEILQKKTDFIKSNIKSIQDRNGQVLKATQEIDSMLDNLST